LSPAIAKKCEDKREDTPPKHNAFTIVLRQNDPIQNSSGSSVLDLCDFGAFNYKYSEIYRTKSEECKIFMDDEDKKSDRSSGTFRI
jgi:hypothetical protein